MLYSKSINCIFIEDNEKNVYVTIVSQFSNAFDKISVNAKKLFRL